MVSRARAQVVVALLLAAVLVGCRGKGDAPTTPTPESPTSVAATSTALPAGEVIPGTCVTVERLSGAWPGDSSAATVEETYPFLSTTDDLAGNGYVEEEFLLRGEADAYARDGTLVEKGVPYVTRIIIRRPVEPSRFSGTVLVEWQNVTAGYDLDALWDGEGFMREGYAWVGVSAQRVGVEFLRRWSPTRYGELDVTGGGAYQDDELSYAIFAQAALVLREEGARCPGSIEPLGGLEPRVLLGIGASQSAARMVIYVDRVLPQRGERPFDGFAFVVGPAPRGELEVPVFHILSETDVRTAERRPDDARYRRWEVAGAAHAGYRGYAYRKPILDRDLPGGAPAYECQRPPLSRVPLHHVLRAAYAHLVRWAEEGVEPPRAPYILLDESGAHVRNELGLAVGGIQLSQVAVPVARNTGTNAGPGFCILLGSYEPFDREQLRQLYPTPERYLGLVSQVDENNLRLGYLLPEDAAANFAEAEQLASAWR